METGQTKKLSKYQLKSIKRILEVLNRADRKVLASIGLLYSDKVNFNGAPGSPESILKETAYSDYIGAVETLLIRMDKESERIKAKRAK